MHRNWKIALPLIFIVASIAAASAMFGARPETQHVPVETPTLLVQVAIAERQPVTFTVQSQGSVTPRTETTIVAEASGRIVEVSDAFVSGGSFAEGDVLIRIDPRNYESALLKAQANVARALTQLATESALAGYAEDDWQRLRQSDPRTAPASELALRKPQLQQAIAELQFAEAEQKDAEDDLDRTTIRAPYTGIVRDKVADVGQYVNVGSELARTFAVDFAEVRLPITQQDLRYLDILKLRLGEPFDVVLSAELGGTVYRWPGKITRSERVFDTTSRVLYLVAQVEDPYALGSPATIPLLMGTFVSAEIVGQEAGELFLIPRHALERGNTLWVVDQEGRIYPRELNIVRRDADFVYIAEGLDEGERYCVTPIDQPLPGMKVRFDA
ncbi:MAG: efflux RND transporter periplasmic adaptor subunit [Gammaproteobacteria bacterium]|nr:efflux RND transporter periplasmic adaptor subunit [Gammaproteobacteria bacterium]